MHVSMHAHANAHRHACTRTNTHARTCTLMRAPLHTLMSSWNPWVQGGHVWRARQLHGREREHHARPDVPLGHWLVRPPAQRGSPAGRV